MTVERGAAVLPRYSDEVCSVCASPAILLTLSDHGHVLGRACTAHTAVAVATLAAMPSAWLIRIGLVPA